MGCGTSNSIAFKERERGIPNKKDSPVSSHPYSVQIDQFDDYWVSISNTALKHNHSGSPSALNLAFSIFKNLNISVTLISADLLVEHSSWSYQMRPITEEDKWFYLPLLALEFSLYPISFISKLGIKQIIWCHSLIFKTASYEQYRAAIPDYSGDTLGMVYCAKEREVDYVRLVIHHEWYHYYDFVHHGPSYCKRDASWETFNPVGFKYGGGGYTHRKIKINDYSNNKCFVSEYATSAIEEDKAETFGHLVLMGLDLSKDNERQGVIGKVKIIKQQLMIFDQQGFSGTERNFWARAVMLQRKLCDVYYRK